MRSLFVAAVLVGLAAASARGQTLAEVQQAVDENIGLTDQAEAARESLRTWGNAALPFLRQIAGSNDDADFFERNSLIRADGTRLITAVQQVGTPEAVELIVEMLDGKTGVPPTSVLIMLVTMLDDHRGQLSSHVRFQQLIFKFAKEGAPRLSDLARSRAAGVMASMGWDEGVPLLELMLKDKDLDVRESAAAALTTLTGEKVELPPIPLSFPHAADRDELVLLATRPWSPRRGRLETWFDGSPAFITGHETELLAADGAEEARDRIDVGLDVADVLSLPLPDGGRRWLLMGAEETQGFSTDLELAACVDADRRELWRFVPQEDEIGSTCRLYDTSGCIGVAFGLGGKEGVVARDLDGRELFQVPFTYVTYELASNARVPGLWLHCGGDIEVRDNRGTERGGPKHLPWQRKPSGGYLYAKHAVLALDAQGEPVIIAGGSTPHSSDQIVRCDVDLHEAWRATLSDDIEALALLEPPDRAPLVVATTKAGELLVFDLDGGLHQRLAMPSGSGRRADRVATYSISTGALPGGRYGVAIGLLGNTLLYALR